MKRTDSFQPYPTMLWKKNLLLSGGLLLLIFRLSICQDKSIDLLNQNQYNLIKEGKAFLINEAYQVSFFLLGELHGDKEIPMLLNALWPNMNNNGYNHIVAEISPWTAFQLEFGTDDVKSAITSLWTKEEASFVHTKTATMKNPTLWGCDMQEMQLEMLIKELAQVNPKDPMMSLLLYKVKNGYNRKMSPDLLNALITYKPPRDKQYNNTSLFENIIYSLKIDSARAFPHTKFKAQLLRENLMKQYFIKQYRNMPRKSKDKILFRYGRNHLHRGFDSRGISTMGNFVTEFALSEGLKSFNVAAFGAGGKYSMPGGTFDADERNDDLAFQFLAEHANYESTIFDLRPLRVYLHTIGYSERTNLQNRLLYWADSYDAIICFKNVTPLHSSK